MNKPRILILGSTDATLVAAQAAIEARIKIAAIVTVGDTFNISYAKEGVKVHRGSDVAAWGASHDIDVLPFESYQKLNPNEFKADGCLVAGWYHMVPSSFRTLFPRGAIGFHASLLPQLRGGAPLNWAILSQLQETGVTLFQLDDGIDDGLIFGQEKFAIGPRDRVTDLIAKANEAVRRLTKRLLPAVLDGSVSAYPQTGHPTYALQRTPQDGHIDWHASAIEIDRLVRAVTKPYPGTFSKLGQRIVRIWAAEPVFEPKVFGAMGQIAVLPHLQKAAVVTGDGLLHILEATFDDDGTSAMAELRRSSNQRLVNALCL